MPKISIIVPVYNTEPYLSRCVDSILSQSFTDFELLLVDDGSTDGSGKICDAYAEKDSRIRVFHKENGGVSSARNMGLDKARGEWITFVDSDDELLSNGLQVMMGGVSDEVDLIMAGYVVCNDEGEKIYSIEKRISEMMLNTLAVKEMYAPADHRYQGYICSKLFRNSVLSSNSIRFASDIFFSEDRLFVTQFICVLGRRVSYTSTPIYKYYEWEGSAMMALKKSFNPKFVTDLEASARMNEMVKSLYKDDALLELCDFEVYKAYGRIVGMMKDFDVDDRAIKTQLRFRLLSVIGKRKYIKYEIQRDKRRLLNKLKKIR